VGSALLDPASDVGDALVSADGSPLLVGAGAWLVSVLGATNPGEGGVDPADGDGDALVVTGADDGTGAGLFSADVAGACSATDGRAIRGDGGSALVAGALAAVVGATVEGLAVDDCVTGAWVWGGACTIAGACCVAGACVWGACVCGACVCGACVCGACVCGGACTTAGASVTRGGGGASTLGGACGMTGATGGAAGGSAITGACCWGFGAGASCGACWTGAGSGTATMVVGETGSVFGSANAGAMPVVMAVREITTPDARTATTFRRPRVFNGASILHLLHLCHAQPSPPRLVRDQQLPRRFFRSTHQSVVRRIRYSD
jgi:hypothetical protein